MPHEIARRTGPHKIIPRSPPPLEHGFKHDVQELADQLGVEIRVAPYPSYCAKSNLIERRLFPHITRACQGMLFDTLDTVVT